MFDPAHKGLVRDRYVGCRLSCARGTDRERRRSYPAPEDAEVAPPTPEDVEVAPPTPEDVDVGPRAPGAGGREG